MVDLTRAIRAKITAPGFLLTHAPQSPYLTLKDTKPDATDPGFYGSYLSVLAQLGPMGPATIDFFNTQCYNQNSSVQGCPQSAVILNNLLAPKPTPSPLYPVFGQLVPPNPETTAWCADSQDPMAAGMGLMFWLQTTTTPDSTVDEWFPRARSKGLSPPNRVAYYMNEPGAILENDQGYSRANVVIIGFAFPVMNTYGAFNCADYIGAGDVVNDPIYSSVPAWATFRLCYGGWASNTTYLQYLRAWRSREPLKRKIMVGIGGALATPMYDTWARGNNVATVAQGLKEFLAFFKFRYGFDLDGIDIDYEDSANLNPTHVTKPPILAALLTSVAPVPSPVSPVSPVSPASPSSIAFCVLFAIIIVGLIAALVLALHKRSGPTKSS
jgi:hypothetical protein